MQNRGCKKIVKSILTFGCKIWTTTERHRDKRDKTSNEIYKEQYNTAKKIAVNGAYLKNELRQTKRGVKWEEIPSAGNRKELRRFCKKTSKDNVTAKNTDNYDIYWGRCVTISVDSTKVITRSRSGLLYTDSIKFLPFKMDCIINSAIKVIISRKNVPEKFDANRLYHTKVRWLSSSFKK